MTAVRQHLGEVGTIVVLALLILAAYFAFGDRLQMSPSTSVGDAIIAPVCETQGLPRTTVDNDGTGDTAAAQQGIDRPTDSATFCQS